MLMKTIIIVLLVLIIIAIAIVIYSKYDNIRYIRKLAKKYTFEEINEFGKRDKDLLEKAAQSNNMSVDNILDDFELWEQVYEYKLHK